MTTLAILGPTAAGKSAVALDVAARRRASGDPVEIVAIDAFTVYRGMDLGTAKPSLIARREVPHRLVDILDPSDELTVAVFQDVARDAIAGVRARGAIPLLVGGSGLYWRAVVDDLQFPPTDPEVRLRLTDRYENDPMSAHAQLAAIDPQAAERIEPANVRRTIRALEVVELTGRAFSSFADAWDRYESIYPDLEVAYLEPTTSELRAAIAGRARRMVADGLLDEAARLQRGPQPLSRTAQQAIGYAEAFAVLRGEAPRETLAEAIAARTWRYARRQRSWFWADPRCASSDAVAIADRLGGR